MVRRHHRDGDFQFVVTVSPVPLQATFTDQDVIVANAESKAVLRAAAGAFARRHDNVSYFPSYEMVTHSHPDFALRPDRAHVEWAMVDRIMSSFIDAYPPRPSEPPSPGRIRTWCWPTSLWPMAETPLWVKGRLSMSRSALVVLVSLLTL